MPAVYAVIIALAFVVLPANPDEMTISSNLLINFRIVSTITMGIFWGILSILLGSFWDIVKPHKNESNQTQHNIMNANNLLLDQIVLVQIPPMSLSIFGWNKVLGS